MYGHPPYIRYVCRTWTTRSLNTAQRKLCNFQSTKEFSSRKWAVVREWCLLCDICVKLNTLQFDKGHLQSISTLCISYWDIKWNNFVKIKMSVLTCVKMYCLCKLDIAHNFGIFFKSNLHCAFFLIATALLIFLCVIFWNLFTLCNYFWLQ